MLLNSLFLKQFRSYDEYYFDFSPKINLICGGNAIGKTTVLEAIHLLMGGKSFRTSQTKDMIQVGQPYFFIEAAFKKNEIDQKLRFSFDGKNRHIFHNNTVCASASNLLGLMQGCVLTPDDASMVKGAPLARRHYLDMQNAQADPLYVHHLMRYNRAMQQRNVLLRSKQLATIESWEYEMANAAAYIVSQRSITTENLNIKLRELYRHLSGENEELALRYRSGPPEGLDSLGYRDFFIHLFYKHRKREADMGFTLNGPHKDDLLITIGDKEARFFASEGQQRSCIAAMRFAEWERLKERTYDMPLMLIDDVGISLDEGRRARLFELLTTLGQVFLTTTSDTWLESENKLVISIKR